MSARYKSKFLIQLTSKPWNATASIAGMARALTRKLRKPPPGESAGTFRSPAMNSASTAQLQIPKLARPGSMTFAQLSKNTTLAGLCGTTQAASPSSSRRTASFIRTSSPSKPSASNFRLHPCRTVLLPSRISQFIGRDRDRSDSRFSSFFGTPWFVESEEHRPASTPGILLRVATCDSSQASLRPSLHEPRNRVRCDVCNRGTYNVAPVPRRPQTHTRFLHWRPTVAVRASPAYRAKLLHLEQQSSAAMLS